MKSVLKGRFQGAINHQIHKNNTEKPGKLKPMPIDNFKPMEHIQIDFIGKFSNQSEKKYIKIKQGREKKREAGYTKTLYTNFQMCHQTLILQF